MGKSKFVVLDCAPLMSDDSSGLLTRSLGMYEVSTAKTLKGRFKKVIVFEKQKQVFSCWTTGGVRWFGTETERFLCFSEQLVEFSEYYFLFSSLFRLLLAIASDIHLFDVSVGCTEYSPDSSKSRIEQLSKGTSKSLFPIPEDTAVVALRFLPSSDVVLIVLDSGTIVFGNLTNRLTYTYQAIGIFD